MGLLSAGLAAALCVGRAAAEPAVPGIDEALAQLDEGDWEHRETTTISMSMGEEVPLKAIEAVLKRDDLSPEQRARVLLIARERFVIGPRAAMGVQFANNGFMMEPDGRVMIEKVFPEFPAFGVVIKGDQIVEVNGQPVQSTGDPGRTMLRPHIIAADPGDSLKLTVVREGKRLVLDVPLGRYRDLPQSIPLSQFDLASGWAVRSAGYRVNVPSATIEMPTMQKTVAPAGLGLGGLGGGRLLAGGRSRGLFGELDGVYTEQRNGQLWTTPTRSGPEKPAIRPGLPHAQAAGRVEQLTSALSQSTQMLREVQLRLNELRQVGAGGPIDQAALQAAAQQLPALMQRQSQLLQEIAMLRQQLSIPQIVPLR